MADLFKTLKSYQQSGVNAIPLKTGAKTPVTYHGSEAFSLEPYFNRLMTDEELKKWGTLPETGNIGIILGPTSNNLVVVDVDDTSKVQEYLAKYPTKAVKTPSGGVHLYYVNNYGDLPNGRLEEGVDFFAQNHYVVAPPSHASSSRGGTSYSGDYQFINDLPVANFPPEYVGRLFSAGRGAGKSGKYSRDEIRGLLDYVLEHGHFLDGAHNDTLFYGSMMLAGDGWDKAAVLAFMLRADEHDPSPQGANVVASTVERAFERYAQQKEKKLSQSANVQTASRQQAKDVELKTYSFADLADQFDGYETTWLIDKWVIDKSVMMMFAPPERYKTWLALDMAISVATGLPFLDTFEVKQGKVLIVQQEDFGPNLIRRMEMIERGKYARSDMGVEIRQVDDSTWLYKPPYQTDETIALHVDGELSLDNPASLVALEHRIAEFRPSLVIIDPFYSLSSADDYFASAANKIRDVIKSIRNKYGCAFIFIHHTSKGSGSDSDGDPQGRNKAFGSQLLNAAMEGSIGIARPKGAGEREVEVRRRYKDADVAEPIKLTFHINKEAPDDCDVYKVDVEDVSVEQLTDTITDWLIDNGPASLKDIYEAFGDVFSSKPRAREFLLKMPNVVQDGSKCYLIKPDVRV